MVLETNVYISDSEINEISLSCVDLKNEGDAYKVLNELAEKGIFAVPRENKLYFTTLEEDEKTRKILEEVLSKIDVKPSIQKDCKKINPEENIDYFRIIMSNAIRYHILNKRKLSYQLPNTGSGIYICTEKVRINNIEVCRGLRLTIDVFDNRVEISAEYKVKVLNENKKLSKEMIRKIRELSLIKPKNRYNYILEVMKDLFEDHDSITIQISQDMRINFRRMDFPFYTTSN
ncbi:hypothetical protein SJAV_12210 [Sulfurisphaera javensis]|uniref:Uncharacterized protein n=1 Tax=Sulfurisphaera javensis TaxID=2049879 RepID=A0AAT9GR05_9CREN